MAFALIKPSVAAGELSPSLFGRTDFAKWHVGASVMRNMFVNYRGGASSRAGTKFVGKCLQAASASSTPPKIIRFQFNIFQSYILEFGDGYMRVAANGAYVTETPVNVIGATAANPCVIDALGHTFVDNDWVFAANLGGMTQLNNRTFIIANCTASTFTLKSIFGDPINSLNFDAYTSGGTVARIFTNSSSPYAAVDLPYLKVTQSADVMSLTCVNQETGTEYPAYDLARLAANSWEFDLTDFSTSAVAPASLTATATVTVTPPALATQYAFCVTSVDRNTGQESVASPIAYVTDSVDIGATAGSVIIKWPPVDGAIQYNIYMAPAAYDAPVPVGSSFGYIGSSFGNQFVNSNIVPDFTKTPPVHINPFARGQLIGALRVSGGSGYAQATTTASIASTTGAGAVLAPVVVDGAVTAIIVMNAGHDYRDGDVITVTDSAAGTGAAFTSVVGPQTGTYPGVVGYFQQRRFYSHSYNNPDTYWMTQTGAYQNMDSGSVPIDSDALSGTPWAQQINGVQWGLPMPGGLIMATGLDAWQVSGTSGAGSLLTPSQQSAQPQESNGFSPTVRPLKINYNILYVQALGSLVRDLEYNFFNNIYAGTDLSMFSNHLFENYLIKQWAWAKDPHRLVWSTRDDGKFLSLTYAKEPPAEVVAWSRHDTNGLVVGNEVATEPPVDAPYFLVKRYIVGKRQWAYYLERMDNRRWEGPEDPWCVDCGLALEQPAPAATLSAAAAEGPGNITGGYLAQGGINYTAPSAQIVDPARTGADGTIMLTVTDGEITGFTITDAGQNYSPGTYIKIIDSTGAGGLLVPLISQNVLFDASADVFGTAAIGDVIRIGGGSATISAVNSVRQVLAAITVPIKYTVPNDPNRLPVPAPSGKWTLTRPVTSVGNLDHLEGMLVDILADGVVIKSQIVENGSLTLATPASSIKIGLPFIAQLQGMYAEIPGQPTIQGKEKKITKGTIRMEKSRGIQIGADQPVASTLDYQQEIPWANMRNVPDQAAINAPAAAIPLFTGDRSAPIGGNWQNWNGVEPSPGMMCAQQTNPLPMNVLAMIPEIEVGQTNG